MISLMLLLGSGFEGETGDRLSDSGDCALAGGSGGGITLENSRKDHLSL